MFWFGQKSKNNFEGNENKKICFWNLLTFSFCRVKKINFQDALSTIVSASVENAEINREFKKAKLKSQSYQSCFGLRVGRQIYLSGESKYIDVLSESTF